MKFDIKDIQLLLAIEEQGGFNKAADSIFKTPAAITQRISKLEKNLGVCLFDRSFYRPQLTKEGRHFINQSRHIVKELERLEFDLKNMNKGFESEFSIAYDDLISYETIYPLILKFQKAISKNVSFRLHREILNGCWDALLQNRATLVIGANGESPPGLPFAEETLGTVHFVFAVAPHHPLSSIPDPIPNEEISSHFSIMIADTPSKSNRGSGVLGGQPVIQVPNMDAKIAAQVQGLGVGYLARHRITPLLESGALLERKVAKLKSEVTLKMAWRTDTYSPILEWFLEEISQNHIDFISDRKSIPN